MGRYCIHPMVYHKGDDSVPMRKITFTAVMIVTVLSVLLIATPKTISAQFVLSEWDYPDEYGQGIEGFLIYENSTGDWELWQNDDASGPYYEHDDTQAHYFQWNASVFIKLRVITMLNSTLLGLGTHYSEGIPFIRHNVTVTTLDETKFSQANFTFVIADDDTYAPMWWYTYDVILDFVPLEGYTYTVTITYEVYY